MLYAKLEKKGVHKILKIKKKLVIVWRKQRKTSGRRKKKERKEMKKHEEMKTNKNWKKRYNLFNDFVTFSNILFGLAFFRLCHSVSVTLLLICHRCDMLCHCVLYEYKHLIWENVIFFFYETIVTRKVYL